LLLNQSIESPLNHNTLEEEKLEVGEGIEPSGNGHLPSMKFIRLLRILCSPP